MGRGFQGLTDNPWACNAKADVATRTAELFRRLGDPTTSWPAAEMGAQFLYIGDNACHIKSLPRVTGVPPVIDTSQRRGASGMPTWRGTMVTRCKPLGKRCWAHSTTAHTLVNEGTAQR